MTSETGKIPRYDRKAPPPFFDLDRLPENLRKTVQTAGVWGPIALAAAWEIHERENDPPGMWSLDGAFGLRRRDTGDVSLTLCVGEDDPRAAAWSWFWTRADLSRREDALTDPQYENEAIPTWPDDLRLDNVEVARRLADVEEIEDVRAGDPEDE